MEKNEIFGNIMTRTSIRSYTSKPIEEEKINMLLHAGMAAPSACNKQPWHFIAITNREILNQIPTFSPYASMVKQAPLAIVVCGDLSKTLEGKEQEFWIQDCSAATENILLMAQGLQLGAVWTALYPLQERLKDGNARLYDQQYAKFKNLKVAADTRVQPLLDMIHRYCKGYEQEGYIGYTERN